MATGWLFSCNVLCLDTAALNSWNYTARIVRFYIKIKLTELFPIALKLPDGFSYRENFITNEEEATLLDFIKNIELRPMLFQGYEAKRKVASFGYDFSFVTRQLAKGRLIPADLDWLLVKVANEVAIPKETIGEVLLTEYPVGSVINWHRDAHPFDIVVGISLLSNCTFKLRPHEEEKRNRKTTVSIPVKRRSLYVMSGASREAWQHCIAPVGEIRYSITLRTLK